MGKLFGTDGIRGVVNAGLDADLAYKVGLAAAQVLAKDKQPGEKPLVTIGKDTRISGDLLKGSLIAGLCTAGADVMDLGTLPTPGVAWVTVDEGADAGIVISASHNPFEHNGIKIFNGQGFKLSDELEEKIEETRMTTLLSGEYDSSNAILQFHAGAGGTEAQDWAQMLYRMYTRWAERHGFTYKILDYEDGDEAGIKSATIMIEGENAYGLLKSENGVHRLVRVSPFDANARRQTSFASLEVMPELDNTIQVDIRPEDIEMQVFRSSGAGGQHINKTSSAVRLIHKPTGVVVSCQTQRSQFQNRDYAMEMLKAKLYQIAKQQHMDKIDDIKGVQNEIAWGHQIRSYVFMPYTMVKDHRTNYETGNVDAVMDGDLDGFIFAYLKAASRGELQDT